MSSSVNADLTREGNSQKLAIFGLVLNSQTFFSKHRSEMRRAFIAGYSAFPVVGTSSCIAESLIKMSRLGFDGMTLSWIN